MTTFKEYLENEIRLTKAHRKPDVMKGRYAQLLELEERSGDEEKEFRAIEASLRATFKYQAAKKQATALMGAREKNNRAEDAHTKILIGVAASQIAKRNPQLLAELRQVISAIEKVNMQRVDAILGLMPK